MLMRGNVLGGEALNKLNILEPHSLTCYTAPELPRLSHSIQTILNVS